MILVLAGTRDGRELAAAIACTGARVMVSTVSEYGRELAQHELVETSAGALDADRLTELIVRKNISLVIDASHPYAMTVSLNALAACAKLNVRYVRFERRPVLLPGYDKLQLVPNPAEAAKIAARLGKVVFLTSGSRTLAIFKNEPLLAGHRIIARVLPDPAVLAECFSLGFRPRDLVAMQGPFSHRLNKTMFQEYGAEVVVTKNSGRTGGSDTKIAAAVELGLPLVVIDRPAVEYPCMVSDIDEVLKYVKEVME